MSKRINRTKYKGMGRPRRVDYYQSLSPFEHESYASASTDWLFALVAGVMLALVVAILFGEVTGLTDAFINLFA